jgi:hypothetical protein
MTEKTIKKVNPNPTKGYCACGKLIVEHKKYKENKSEIDKLVILFEQVGQYIKITDSKHRTFLVQRYYIALHGIEEENLHKLGFTRIENKQ